YYSGMYSTQSRQIVVRDVTNISPLSVVLLGGPMIKSRKQVEPCSQPFKDISNGANGPTFDMNNGEMLSEAALKAIKDPLAIQSVRFELANFALTIHDAKLTYVWRNQLETYLKWFILLTGIEEDLTPVASSIIS